MRFLTPAVCCVYCAAMIPRPANGIQIISTDIHGEKLVIDEDTFIAPGTNITVKDVYLNASTYIQNAGSISGTIHICDNCKAYISNSGQISSHFIHGGNSTLTQIITSSNEIRTISDYDTEYTIQVLNASDINLNDLYKIAPHASKITLSDSSLFVENTSATPRPDIKIELIGENTLSLSQIPAPDTAILQNITDTGGSVNINLLSSNPLYSATGYITNGDLRIHMIRETDYAKILPNKTGNFLHNLRTHNPQDKLLQHLDNAVTMPQIKHSLHKSMRTNPSRFKHPLRTLSQHFYTLTDTEYLIGLQPFAITGHNIHATGTRTGVTLHTSQKFHTALGIDYGYTGFSDGIDNFEGNFIGLTANAQYDIADTFIRIIVDAMKLKINTPELITGNYSARSIIAHTGVTAGKNIRASQRVTLSPFVGLRGEYTRVFDTITDCVADIGINADYKYKTNDIIYNYRLSFTASTNHSKYISVAIGGISPDDSAGIYFSVGALRDIMGQSYKISLNATFDF